MAGVNVNRAVETVPSVGSELLTGIVTSLVGWDGENDGEDGGKAGLGRLQIPAGRDDEIRLVTAEVDVALVPISERNV